MSIREVFSRAYELWKRDVLWLILAGIVIGVIIWAVLLVAGLIVGALAIGGVGLGVSGSNNTFSGVGTGVIFVAVIVGIAAVFLIAVLGVTLQGGLFEMVIGAAREDRPVRFGDLFSGFRRFGAYALFALVVFGIMIGLGILFVTLIGIPVAIALGIWIGIMWIYILPLIADHGLTFGNAQRRSREMVKSVGWWRTFGRIVLLWVIIAIVDIIIGAIFGGGTSDPGSGKYIAYQFISLIISAIWSTYTVCYISTMYLNSGGVTQPAIAGAPPAPPAGGYPVPPAPGFAAPPAPPAPTQPPVTPVTPAIPVTPAGPMTPGADTVPPAPPAPEAGTAVTEATAPAAESAGETASTAQTEATEAAQTAAPEPPVAPPEAPSAPTNPPVPPPLT